MLIKPYNYRPTIVAMLAVSLMLYATCSPASAEDATSTKFNFSKRYRERRPLG